MFFTAILRTLIGEDITVELKNDLSIRGRLEAVDQYLNVRLAQVQVHTAAAPPVLQLLHGSCTVRGSCIRYIHLPVEKVDTELLQEATRRVAAATKETQTMK
ncbi:snRNP core Sm-like protein SmX5 [Cyanidioschyzon merolae strain 10D]|uniref:SnRNP core Sm-like protein SmX5 n=1 Tax=Cyanidioschyzon merolae (strain NIES-3377 / 10D) TaxID=280699 RepID=M1VEK0_CYAM1|nr:snRNP core Sm-like protein SmX5 [Cyanidioschyzon merolae strain 10D]BAM78933.1 snRNP core Sm-like protein SmX5 [Cyanidioschyzon merolae strain 10D]|eukprot:XP_005535219.1 snRNP core Sm-like protein SmX5 [Cyanidioschyzon merolae strain 10D]